MQEQNSNSAEESTRNPLWRLFKDVPTSVQILGFLSGLIGVVVPSLGYLAHERRIQLLGLPREVLEYGPYQAALTGASLLWHLPWRMLNSFTSGDFWICVTAFTALGMAVFRKRLFRRWKKPVRALLITGAALTLVLFSATRYAKLVTLQRDQQPSLISNSGSAATFEWLQNPTDTNRLLVDALAGIAGWLSLAAWVLVIEFWYLARSSTGAIARTAKGGLVTATVSMVFLVGQLPSAHACAAWGFRYPRVEGLSPGCDDGLAKLLATSEAKAWDISLGAKAEYLLVKEVGRHWRVQPINRSGGGRCASLGADEVIPLDTNSDTAGKETQER